MNFSSKMSSLWSFLFLLLAVCDVSWGQFMSSTTSSLIQCYTCQSSTNQICADPFVSPIQQCSSIYGCAKQVGTNTQTGNKTYTRSCPTSSVGNNAPGTAACVGGQIGQLYEVTCVCYTNLCNTGQHLSYDVIRGGLPLLLLTLFTAVTLYQ